MLQAQTVSELYFQYIRGVGWIFWVLGHQVQVSRGMALKNRQTHTLFPSINNQDLLRPHQRTTVWMGRLLCEVITDNSRHGGEKKRGDDAWKRRNLKTPSGVPFFSSIWFQFPCMALHHRGKWGKVGCSEQESGERAKERNDSHPQE